jgi:hypothetical protein
MNPLREASTILISALIGLTAQAQSLTPFLETAALTFNWGYSDTYISSSETGIPPGTGNAILDPNLMDEFDIITTDTGTVRPYTNTIPGAGNQKFFTDRMVQKLIREGVISPLEEGLRWQFTAVRNAPRTVAEMASNPYTVYLTAIDPVPVGRPYSPVRVPLYGLEEIDDDVLAELVRSSVQVINTGITITLGQSNGTFTERAFNNTSSSFTAATGSVTTAFNINFGARFYDDPRHRFDAPKRTEYHLKRHLWQSSASGLISYRLKSIPGPLPAFIATNVSATATGWFTHAYTEIKVKEEEEVLSLDGPILGYSYAGVAPLRIRLGNVQYQKRSVFPDFTPPIPAP